MDAEWKWGLSACLTDPQGYDNKMTQGIKEHAPQLEWQMYAKKRTKHVMDSEHKVVIRCRPLFNAHA